MKLAARIMQTLLLPAIMVASLAIHAVPAQAQAPNPIRIDVPVTLKQVKVFYNLDHAAFGGDMPVGLGHMTMMLNWFKQTGAEWKMVGIFHGDAAYMLLNDETYNAVRRTKTGNPYKGMVENLIKQGAQIEACAVTMRGNKWGNDNLLPGVKVNTGADVRIIELVQQGYVMLQP